MGMFDRYKPIPPVRCPCCGAALDGWQGKDGPCDLWKWIQGSAVPARGLVDEDDLPSPGPAPGEVRLPDVFGIYTECPQCARWIEAEGSCDGGVWTRLDLLDPLEPPGLPEGWRPMRDEDRWRVLAELRREIPVGHVLHGLRLTPLARGVRRDDVLVRAAGAPAPLYLVHLTWSVETDPAWPFAQPFESLHALAEAD